MLEELIRDVASRIDPGVLRNYVPSKGLRILARGDGEAILVRIDRESISLGGEGKHDAEVSASLDSWKRLLRGEASALGLLASGELTVKGRLTNLLRLLNILSNYGVKVGLEEFGVCGVLRIVFERICPGNEDVMNSVRNYQGSFQFGVINGESCCLEISNGSLRVTQGLCPNKPSASIYTDLDTWLAIFRGEEDIGMVALDGRVKIGGSVFQAFKLKSIIDKVL